MISKEKDPVRKCPYPECDKCIAIKTKGHELLHVCFHKGEPPARPGSIGTSHRRRCPHCREYFFVENYFVLTEVLHWLIFNDPAALARGVFENNTELVKKLRQDKLFMALINSTEFDD